MTGQPTRERYFQFLVLLLSADIVFVLLHFLHLYSAAIGDVAGAQLPSLTPDVDSVIQVAASGDFSLERDGGHAEMFQYVKLFWIVVMLSALFVRTRTAVFCFWALLFGYLLLDDALRIHEELGGRLARHFGYGPWLGLRPEDFGELTVAAFVGGVLLVLIGGAYWLSDDPARAFSLRMAALLAALAFFGVVVDMMGIALAGPPGNALFGTIEDGGEMLIVSVTCWYVFSTLHRAGMRDPSDGGSGSTRSRTRWTSGLRSP